MSPSNSPGTNGSLAVAQILSGAAKPGDRVIVRGWVRTRRDSKAGLSFIHLHDGSGFEPIQIVAPTTLPNYEKEILHVGAGCAIEAEGTLAGSQGKGQAVELQAERI